jgi:HEAT repeat protein/outer membrane protein assembly factor BamD (BamD/ComL family)
MKKIFFISLLIFSINFVLMPMVKPVSAAEKPKDVKSGDEKFDRIFREARDLHDQGEWKQAIEKFKEIVCDCPEKKYVDAAFYWLADSYRKLRMYKEAAATLERLVKNFPESAWADDARVMSLELAAAGGQNVFVTSGGVAYAPQAVQTITGVGTGNVWTTSAQTQLDREDEIKLAAFQSLLSADPKRSIEKMGELLQADSKASETLKREVIRSLRNRHSLRSSFSGNFSYYESVGVGTQNLQLLRDTLLRSFRSNSNVKIRTEIIYLLINFNDEQSVNYLSQLYASENDKEIKKAIINAFGNAGNFFYYSFGQFTPFVTATVAPSPIEKTDAEKIQLEKAVVAKAQAENAKNEFKTREFKKIYFEKLLEIVRTEKDTELRRLAFQNLQRFVGWSTRDGIVEMFLEMYNAETDEEFKISVIQALGNIKQPPAVNKLLDIAKNDKSNKLRLEAIFALRNNKSPEVIKFLEDLIK